MSSRQIVFKKTNGSSTKKQLVPLFEIFVDQIYGEQIWDEMLLNATFSDLIVTGFPKYGDIIFHDLVNMICDENNIEIQDILREFGNFINKNYS